MKRKPKVTVEKPPKPGMPPEKVAKLRIHKAYLLLLRVPVVTISRTNIQAALAACRDELARLSNVDPEVMQTSCESHALDIEEGRAPGQKMY